MLSAEARALVPPDSPSRASDQASIRPGGEWPRPMAIKECWSGSVPNSGLSAGASGTVRV
jgi:hypothetical protein